MPWRRRRSGEDAPTTRVESYDVAKALAEEHAKTMRQLTNQIRSLRRLSALASLAITERDQVAIDGLARVSSIALKTPYAFVTLLDEENQEHIVAIGVAPSTCKVEDSLCRYTVTSEQVSVIEGLQTNPFFAHIVADIPEASTYLGAPWYYRDQAMGAFCVLGEEERSWGDIDVNLVETCADQISVLLDTPT